MVVRLEGVIDGSRVVFSRKAGDWWEATVPRHLNGIYIVDLTAVDEAGNIGKSVRYILAFSHADLRCILIRCPYIARLKGGAGGMLVIMDAGETLHIQLEIINIKGEDFAVESGTYEFTGRSGMLVDKGSVNIINSHVMDVVVTPPCRGEYSLKYTYIIADETLIDIVKVVVK